MKQFWNDNITNKSFQVLIKLKNKFNFILIGGWAVYFWTKKMKSKDIDIIVDYTELGKLREKYPLVKNNRLKKYEIPLGEFDIDIYLPHYSHIGLPLEKIHNHTVNLEGFVVPKIEILLLFKLFAYHDRKNSTKGEKDKLDIISILNTIDIDWKFFNDYIKKNNLEMLKKEIISVFSVAENIPELNLNNQQISKLKKSILKNINTT